MKYKFVPYKSFQAATDGKNMRIYTYLKHQMLAWKYTHKQSHFRGIRIIEYLRRFLIRKYKEAPGLESNRFESA